MRNAAVAMVKSLTKSLSLVTCKDPLKAAIVTHLGQSVPPPSKVNGEPNFKTEMQLKELKELFESIADANVDLGYGFLAF